MAVPPGPGTSNQTGTPTCFRHPGRETYVSCVRCGRPACPDCLRSAAVGQQCVECIREGNRSIRQPRTVFGGRVAATALVTWTLVGINVAFYLTEWIYPKIVVDLSMIGNAPLTNAGPLIGVADGQWYRLITSAFLHEPGWSGFGPAHILFNMWALIFVGPALEHLLGRLRFLTVYLVSAFGGSVLYYLFGPTNVEALGASGAIFGLFGAWFVVSRRLRLDNRQIVTLIVLNLVISFAVPGIAWQAHVGGLVVGAALTAAYVYAPKVRQSRVLAQAGATAVIVAVLVVAVLVRDHQLAANALG
ncbi:MAG TPA: rhomboid family intramembrane serine protease [Streptosporangiaceae bacterium]|nr:rhomboid family intramembrane serine protease [Streptosporangiaceae bacterium]